MGFGGRTGGESIPPSKLYLLLIEFGGVLLPAVVVAALGGGGDRFDVPFRGADADGGVHAVREDLAVAGLAGPGRHADGFNGLVPPVFVGDGISNLIFGSC